jgi:nucleotide-binding universal stress UspA family protein
VAVKEVKMYKKILAPMDGSQLAECTLDHVTQVAAGCQVPEVILFYVMESIPHPHGSQMGESEVSRATPKPIDDAYRYERGETESEARDYLSKLVDKLKKDGVAATVEMSRGDPAEEIMKYAEVHEADLIIMSTHGRSGVSRWAFGSVADRVIRHSTITVLIAVPKGCRIR